MVRRRAWSVGSPELCGFALVLLLVRVLFAVGVRPTIPPPDRSGVSRGINKRTWLRIKAGMSRVQVVKLIGGPSGAYNKLPICLKGQLSSWTHDLCDSYGAEVWTGETGEIIVCFDDAGIVRHSFYRRVYTSE